MRKAPPRLLASHGRPIRHHRAFPVSESGRGTSERGYTLRLDPVIAMSADARKLDALAQQSTSLFDTSRAYS